MEINFYADQIIAALTCLLTCIVSIEWQVVKFSQGIESSAS